MTLREHFNSLPRSSRFNCFSLVFKFTFTLLIYTTKPSYGTIISITRTPGRADSFNVNSNQGFLCPANTCTKYNAKLTHSGISDSCHCQCSYPWSTFYGTCVESQDLIDENKCTIRFKRKSGTSLPVIDTISSQGKIRLDNNMSADNCSGIKTSWFYYKNNSWIQGSNDLFTVELKQHWTQPAKWFLKWYSGLYSNSAGLIIKMIVTCQHDGIFDTHEKGCLMFKTKGTHKVVPTTDPLTTNRPPISTTTMPKTHQLTSTIKTDTEVSGGSSSTQTATKKQKTSPTSTLPATTIIPNKPRQNTSNGDNRLWIAFAAGGVTVFIVLLACLVFFFLMCRQRKKQNSRREITRDFSSRTENANDPLHDYEYVVYPVLTEGFQSSSNNSLDNAMYERGPDNELIIKTPGVSIESLATNSINHFKDSNHETAKSSSAFYRRDNLPMNHIVNMSDTYGNSKHEYAQLQGKDGTVNSSGIYQPLIRPVTPDTNNERQDESQGIYLELIDNNSTNATPDYMVLEPTDPTTLNL